MSDHEPQLAASRLAVQYEDLPKQHHAARFGMWIFLGSELLLFAGLFGLYTAYRLEYPSEFRAAFHHNNLAIGTTNTVILIVSSFTVAWSIHALRRDRRRTTIWMLAITMLIGVMFLVLKGIEYAQHFEHGVFPGQYYRSHELPGHGPMLFFTMYFLMTGLHAVHMIGGITVMAWLTSRVARRRTTPASHIELEMGGLYWHLVDSIWIFLWPLFYLSG